MSATQENDDEPAVPPDGTRAYQRHGSLAHINYSPSAYIQNLLHEQEETDHPGEHTEHPLFCEIDILHKVDDDELEWKETARWVKYEEDLEEGGERWSKPYVASVSMRVMFELRNTLGDGCVMLDVQPHSLHHLIELLTDRLITEGRLNRFLRHEVSDVLLKPHKHPHQKREKRKSVAAKKNWMSAKNKLKMVNLLKTDAANGTTTNGLQQSRGRAASSPNITMPTPSLSKVSSTASIASTEGSDDDNAPHKSNIHFLKKIPAGAEVANIFIGEMEYLRTRVVVFIRLAESKMFGNLSEVDLPTKFMFIILGPHGTQHKSMELGRAMGTMMVDEIFREVAYKAHDKDDILAGIDEYMEQVTVLPPGEWDPSIRLEPPTTVPSQAMRRNSSFPHIALGHGGAHLDNSDYDDSSRRSSNEDEEQKFEDHADPTLVMSGRLFGGLVADIKRKLPWYGSDFKDCLHLQCVASFIFLYLATLTPNVTFGALLGQSTHNYMAAMECILAAAITGIVFALFSAQPLNILGSTGPMLVLEIIVYNFCEDQNWDYMPFRVWIGLWTCLILLLIVAFDLSALVRFITRFTEETFACLIAIIFIYESFVRLFEIGTHEALVQLHAPEHNYPHPSECVCTLYNMTEESSKSFNNSLASLFGESKLDAYNISSGTFKLNTSETFTDVQCIQAGGSVDNCHYVYTPDVFLMSFILFVLTFTLTIILTHFNRSKFLSHKVRQTISDFGVLISIVICVGIDVAVGIPTPKLLVPDEFKPTASEKRGWFINPGDILGTDDWWLSIAAVIPALLATLLVFMDQQITAVIVNRKEHKLIKGGGYHLDLFVLAILIAGTSFLGLPWYVAATVSALAHIMSLKKESECNAPGEKPVFLGVREQRVTALLVGILSGVTVFMTPLLKLIPMPVLYGIFLYMGVIALFGMQLIQRVLIMCMPKKTQPDYIYLRHVRLWKVHLFTIIQVICLAILWVVKHFKESSIAFPILVVATCFVRVSLYFFYSQEELHWLDNILTIRKKKKVPTATLR